MWRDRRTRSLLFVRWARLVRTPGAGGRWKIAGAALSLSRPRPAAAPTGAGARGNFCCGRRWRGRSAAEERNRAGLLPGRPAGRRAPAGRARGSAGRPASASSSAAAALEPGPGDEVVDLGGRTVMPGNINAHGHLYAALAAGMPAPRAPLSTFTDILTEIWWPLDRALDAEAIYLSAVAGAWDAVRCGTTMIFDHHASLSQRRRLARPRRDRAWPKSACAAACATRSPTAAARGSATSRSRRTSATCRSCATTRRRRRAALPGLVGAHASFTLEDRTLQLLEGICSRQGAGLHIHLAEGTTDREVSRDRGWHDPLRAAAGQRPGPAWQRLRPRRGPRRRWTCRRSRTAASG